MQALLHGSQREENFVSQSSRRWHVISVSAGFPEFLTSLLSKET